MGRQRRRFTTQFKAKVALEAVRKRTELIVRTLDEETLADAQAELEKLKLRRRELEEQVAAAAVPARVLEADPDLIVDRVLERLGKLGEQMEEASQSPAEKLPGRDGGRRERGYGDQGAGDHARAACGVDGNGVYR